MILIYKYVRLDGGSSKLVDIPCTKLILFTVSLPLSSLEDTTCVYEIYLPIKKTNIVVL